MGKGLMVVACVLVAVGVQGHEEPEALLWKRMKPLCDVRREQSQDDRARAERELIAAFYAVLRDMGNVV